MWLFRNETRGKYSGTVVSICTSNMKSVPLNHIFVRRVISKYTIVTVQYDNGGRRPLWYFEMKLGTNALVPLCHFVPLICKLCPKSQNKTPKSKSRQISNKTYFLWNLCSFVLLIVHSFPKYQIFISYHFRNVHIAVQLNNQTNRPYGIRNETGGKYMGKKYTFHIRSMY